MATGKRRVILLTCTVWLLVVCGYASVYVVSHATSAGAEGYEKLWDWQLMFFALTRLPILVVVLLVVVFLETRYFRIKKSGEPDRGPS